MKLFIHIATLSLLFIFFSICQNKPDSCFTPSKTKANVNDTISFDNCSTGSDSYLWNFGDGETSTKTSPTHAFEEPGQFVVSLTASNKRGDDIMISRIAIEENIPVACFGFIPESAIHSGDEVTFTNCSINSESYLWDFGDGSTSISSDPKHTFKWPGTYIVSLMVQKKYLRDREEKTLIVESNK